MDVHFDKGLAKELFHFEDRDELPLETADSSLIIELVALMMTRETIYSVLVMLVPVTTKVR